MLTLIIGGACVGKTSLMKEIIKLSSNEVIIPKTFTNRPRRINETNDSYLFYTQEEIERMVQSDLYIIDQIVSTYLEDSNKLAITYYLLSKLDIQLSSYEAKKLVVKDSCYTAYKNIVDIEEVNPILINLIYLTCNEQSLEERYKKRFKDNEKERDRRFLFDQNQHKIFMQDLTMGKIKSPVIDRKSVV